MTAQHSARWVARFFVAIAAAWAMTGVPVQAAPFLTFEQTIATFGTGTLSYDGAGGPLVGEDIGFSLVSGVGTPFLGTLLCGTTDGVLFTFSPCLLKFETGDLDTDTPTELTWNGNPALGSFQVIGGLVDDTTMTQISPAGSVLLDGLIQAVSLEFKGGGQWEAGLGGIDIKDEGLVEFFYGEGASTDFRYVNSELVISGIGGSGSASDGFDADVSQADLVNSTPEPGSALLMLLGLGSLAAYRRRRS